MPTCANQLIAQRVFGGLDQCDLGGLEQCDLGGLDGITQMLIALRELADVRRLPRRTHPVAFVVDGSCRGSRLSQDGLVELNRFTIGKALDRDCITDTSGGPTLATAG